VNEFHIQKPTVYCKCYAETTEPYHPGKLQGGQKRRHLLKNIYKSYENLPIKLDFESTLNVKKRKNKLVLNILCVIILDFISHCGEVAI